MLTNGAGGGRDGASARGSQPRSAASSHKVAITGKMWKTGRAEKHLVPLVALYMRELTLLCWVNI